MKGLNKIMKKELLRAKAIFQISVILMSILYFSYAIKPVTANEVCCEKTTDGSYCVYGSGSNCDSGYKKATTTCEQTSFCKLGCCYDMDEGQCYTSVSEAKCLSTAGGEWSTDKTCEGVTECQKGCCILGSQCSQRTEQSCALETAKYPELEMVYQTDILTESECVAICQGGDKGCCKNTDDSCVYETRESCEAAEGDFYKEQFCSSIETCECEEKQDKICYNDDVYWTDSCSNTEGIAEDCDYASGTLCKDVDGEKVCGTVNCETTYSDSKNVHDPEMGGFRKNGESWCVYESPVGDGLDRPGSRHYKHMCVNGQEIVEPCRDLREQICMQGEDNSVVEAQCFDNDIYDSAITQQISTVPKGQTFWEVDSDSLCEEANSDCPVVWIKKNLMSSWSCEGNCFCEEAPHIKEMADNCKFIGDCGADFNVLGKFSDDGFSVTGVGKNGPPRELSDSQTKDWNKYGVFGNMVGLYEKIQELIGDILKSGTEAAKKAKDSLDQQKKMGMYVSAGIAVVSSLVMSAITGSALVAAAPGVFVAVGGFAWCWPCLVVIAIILILTMTGDDETFHVTTSCQPWVAPKGGADCEKCLDQYKVDELGFYDSCTEYKCKSLGMNCEFIPENLGTERVACYDSNPNDVNSPIISPWEEALTESFGISLLSQGYEIIPRVPYYQKISFGIKVSELAQCKIEEEHTTSYDEMANYFGDSFYQMEHNITIMPQEGGKTYEYYIRCQDPSGNSNAAEYVIRFTTTEEPDRTPPLIEGTSIEDYSYVAANKNEAELAAYINEPANCKWSTVDRKYDDMENSFQCSSSTTNALGYKTYPCYTKLSLTEGTNTFYFRCEDKSEFLNKNQQSYTYHLTKSEELIISSKSPNGTQYNVTDLKLQVTTMGGAETGKATCSFTDDNNLDESLWPQFFETESPYHSQPLQSLARGDYNYYVICKDIAGNKNETTISFKLADPVIPPEDVTPPEIKYIYMDSVALHVILDEPSTCEYNNQTFTYGAGIKMNGEGTDHNTVYTGEPQYYINCEDMSENHWSNPIIVYL